MAEAATKLPVRTEEKKSDRQAEWRPFEGLGRWAAQGEWLLVEGIVAEKVPELVTAIVSLGGQVEAVVPEHQSLEARFLELLGET